MRTIVILRLSDLIKGYFYGIWLRVVGFRKHHKPLRSTEWVTYIEFQNPHVLVMGTVYSEIGLGVYQGDAVIIREGLCSSEYLRRWVIYKLEDHHLKGHEVEEFLKTACRLAQTILHHKHSESCLKDWQRSDEPEAKLPSSKGVNHMQTDLLLNLGCRASASPKGVSDDTP